MNRYFLRTAAFLGALSVILGAFGAHGLKKMVDASELEVFETAVRYQFYHVFALALAGILSQAYPNGLIRAAGRLFIGGILLFSGSLYLLVYLHTIQASMDWIGVVTPLGGLLLIGGWICLAAGIRSNKPRPGGLE